MWVTYGIPKEKARKNLWNQLYLWLPETSHFYASQAWPLEIQPKSLAGYSYQLTQFLVSLEPAKQILGFWPSLQTRFSLQILVSGLIHSLSFLMGEVKIINMYFVQVLLCCATLVSDLWSTTRSPILQRTLTTYIWQCK